MRHKLRKIFGALAEGRKCQRKNIDAVEEVAAKFIALNQLLEIAVRGDDDAHVHLDGFVAADALDFTFFEHAQQFCLHGHGHVANFVEEKRAGFGLFEFAKMAGSGSGERAFFVAEKFGLDQFGGNSRAIQRDEEMVVPRRLFMNCACDEFLSRACLAQNADARLAGGHALDLREELFHGRT